MDSEEGQRYMTFYKINQWPYVAVLDPRTGELMVEWNHSDAATYETLISEFLITSSWGDEDRAIDPSEPKKRRMVLLLLLHSSFVRVPLRQLVFFFPPYLDRKRYSTPVKMTSCKQQSVLPYRRMLVHRITIRQAMKTMTSRPIGLTLNQIVEPVSRRERKIP